MKKSIGKKLCFIGTSLIGTFVLVNIILTYFFMAPFSTFFYRDQMADLGDSLEEMNLGPEEDVGDKIDEIADQYGVKITVMDNTKRVISTTRAILRTDSEYWQLSMELFDSNKNKIDAGENVFLTRNQQRKNNRKTIQLIMIQKIAENEYVVMSRSYQSLQNAMYSAIIFELVTGVLIIFCGWVVVLRLSKRLVTPIQRMTTTAEQISNLKFDSRIQIGTMDELGQLGTSINKMSERLEQNMTQLQDDIDKRKRLVRNLSHEIKSPMAVIMGYADRMKAIIHRNPEKAVEYCEIISNESARVDSLVKEMLELSKLDQKTDELSLKEIDIAAFCNMINKRFYEENIDKHIDFLVDYEKVTTLKADEVLLERALYNLISNAVFHSTGDNRKITLSFVRKEEYCEIQVFNTGSQIAENDLKTIWEPFHKVDKVRGRDSQGYGVGLSIVREIVEAHNGYCKAYSKEDGVEFVIAIKG